MWCAPALRHSAQELGTATDVGDLSSIENATDVGHTSNIENVTVSAIYDSGTSEDPDCDRTGLGQHIFVKLGIPVLTETG